MPEGARNNSRRSFFVLGLKLLTGFFALGLGIPLTGFFISPARRTDESDTWIKLADFSEILDSRPTKITYSYSRKDGWTKAVVRKMAFVVKDDKGAVTVFSNRCTHLGCGLDWDATAGRFICPCHGGAFNLQGQVVEGPPPRSLVQLTTKIDDRSIFIREA